MLHIAPESAIGGPLALEVSEKELTARRAAWTQAPRPVQRGYLSLLLNEVTPADEGCDFRFLEGTTPTPEPAIH